MSGTVDLPAIGSRWRHSNGSVHRVFSICAPMDILNRPPVVVFENVVRGDLWVRPADGWSQRLKPEAESTQ